MRTYKDYTKQVQQTGIRPEQVEIPKEEEEAWTPDLEEMLRNREVLIRQLQEKIFNLQEENKMLVQDALAARMDLERLKEEHRILKIKWAVVEQIFPATAKAEKE